MRPTSPDEEPHIAAMQTSMSAGFQFRHLIDSDGVAVAVIHAERRLDSVVDTYWLRGCDDAVAARFLSAEYRDPSAEPVWVVVGDVATVIDAVLALPDHGDPSAPATPVTLPDGFWRPDARSGA